MLTMNTNKKEEEQTLLIEKKEGEDIDLKIISDIEGELRFYILFFIAHGCFDAEKLAELDEQTRDLLGIDKKGMLKEEILNIFKDSSIEIGDKRKKLDEILKPYYKYTKEDFKLIEKINFDNLILKNWDKDGDKDKSSIIINGDFLSVRPFYDFTKNNIAEICSNENNKENIDLRSGETSFITNYNNNNVDEGFIKFAKEEMEKREIIFGQTLKLFQTLKEKDSKKNKAGLKSLTLIRGNHDVSMLNDSVEVVFNDENDCQDKEKLEKTKENIKDLICCGYINKQGDVVIDENNKENKIMEIKKELFKMSQDYIYIKTDNKNNKQLKNTGVIIKHSPYLDKDIIEYIVKGNNFFDKKERLEKFDNNFSFVDKGGLQNAGYSDNEMVDRFIDGRYSVDVFGYNKGNKVENLFTILSGHNKTGPIGGYGDNNFEYKDISWPSIALKMDYSNEESKRCLNSDCGIFDKRGSFPMTCCAKIDDKGLFWYPVCICNDNLLFEKTKPVVLEHCNVETGKKYKAKMNNKFNIIKHDSDNIINNKVDNGDIEQFFNMIFEKETINDGDKRNIKQIRITKNRLEASKKNIGVFEKLFSCINCCKGADFDKRIKNNRVIDLIKNYESEKIDIKNLDDDDLICLNDEELIGKINESLGMV